MHVLAAKLREVVGKLVQNLQSAFTKERNIFYGWTVVSEVLDDRDEWMIGWFLRLISKRFVIV